MQRKSCAMEVTATVIAAQGQRIQLTVIFEIRYSRLEILIPRPSACGICGQSGSGTGFPPRVIMVCPNSIIPPLLFTGISFM